MRKTPRERELEKALRTIAAKIIHLKMDKFAPDILEMIGEALKGKPRPAKPISKELRQIYDKAHPHA